jgi:hypothetical protein
VPNVSFLDDVEQETEDKDLRAANVRLSRQLVRAKAKTEDLVEAVYRSVGDALLASPPKMVAPPKRDRRTKAEWALWHLTDLQGSKVTTSYNTEVMRKRVHDFVDTSEHITDIQRKDHAVRSCAVLFGGDMVEGLFQFPQQAFEVDATIFAQWASVSRLLSEVVNRALTIYEFVTVYPEWGNHGRIGSKRDVVPRSDNFDRMCYETARMMVGDNPRLTWNDSAEDIQRVEIGNYRALLMHGDETGRNGFTSPSTFLNYLTKLKAGGYGWSFRDVYSGHRHTHHEMALSDGSGAWYQTGSTESDNRYARDSLGSAAEPSQRLHFIDPDKGRVTAQYKILLG